MLFSAIKLATRSTVFADFFVFRIDNSTKNVHQFENEIFESRKESARKANKQTEVKLFRNLFHLPQRATFFILNSFIAVSVQYYSLNK